MKSEQVFTEKPNILSFHRTPPAKWRIEFAPNCFIYNPRGVNWFHRLMQRLILGIKWEKIVDISKL